MIDVHSHILPGVDDGSKDLEMSIEMARIYIENGFNKVIATPHYIDGIGNSSQNENMKILEELRAELKRENLDIEILLGNEVLASLEIIEALEDERVSLLNKSRYILIELPMFDIPLYMDDVFYELQLRGYIPIIAHPERNIKIMEDPNILYRYIENGVLAQLNLPSLEGKYGGKIKETAEILLKHKMIHFVGTDSHSDRRRSPRVEKALNSLKMLVSKEEFNDLTYRNAECLMADKLFEIDLPIEYKKRNWIVDLFMTRIGVF